MPARLHGHRLTYSSVTSLKFPRFQDALNNKLMLLFNPQKFTLPLSLKHRGNAVANIENISLSCKCFKEKLEKHHFHKLVN